MLLPMPKSAVGRTLTAQPPCTTQRNATWFGFGFGLGLGLGLRPREQLAPHLLLRVAFAAEAARGGVAQLVDERTAAHSREVTHP